MNRKKILFSIASLAVVAGLAVGGTIAFYSDTETSTNNIFTAGSIDLKVDHTRQTYNGEDCTTRCNRFPTEIRLDQGFRNNGTAVLPERSNPNDALGEPDTSGSTPDTSPSGFVSLGFGGGTILHFPDGIDDGPGDDIKIYEATGATNPPYPPETINVWVSVDGTDWTSVTATPSSITFDGTIELGLPGEDAPTVYYIKIVDTTNKNLHDATADGYDLDAVEALHCDNEETDGIVSDIWQCELWEETDLDGQTFFNFSDLKPGDSGTNVISLHVFDNDAWACLLVHDLEDEENTVYEPELPDDDTTGELSNYINVFAWMDDNNDGILDDDEDEIGVAPFGEWSSIASLDSGTGLIATSTSYIGIQWCAGEFVDEGNGIECDGSTVGNDAQSDILTASLTAYATQQRNNEEFSCDDVDLSEPDEEPTQIIDFDRETS